MLLERQRLFFCTAWVEFAGRRHSCTLAVDHTGFHTAKIDGQHIEWSQR